MPEEYVDDPKNDAIQPNRGAVDSPGTGAYPPPLEVSPYSLVKGNRQVMLVIDNVRILGLNRDDELKSAAGAAMIRQHISPGPCMDDPHEVQAGGSSYLVCRIDEKLTGGSGIALFDHEMREGNKYYVFEPADAAYQNNQRMEGQLSRRTLVYLAHPVFEDLRNKFNIAGYLHTVEASILTLPAMSAVFSPEDQQGMRRTNEPLPAAKVLKARELLMQVHSRIDFIRLGPMLLDGSLFDNLPEGEFKEGLKQRTEEGLRVAGMGDDVLVRVTDAVYRQIQPAILNGMIFENIPDGSVREGYRSRVQEAIKALEKEQKVGRGKAAIPDIRGFFERVFTEDERRHIFYAAEKNTTRRLFEALFSEEERHQILISGNIASGYTWQRDARTYLNDIEPYFADIICERSHLVECLNDMAIRVENGSMHFPGIDWELFKTNMLNPQTVNGTALLDYDTMLYGENGIIPRTHPSVLRQIVEKHNLDIGLPLVTETTEPAVHISDDDWEGFTASNNMTGVWRQVQTLLGRARMAELRRAGLDSHGLSEETLGAQELISEVFLPQERRRLLQRISGRYVFRTQEAEDAARRLTGRDFMVAIFDDMMVSLREDEVYMSRELFEQVSDNFSLFTEAYTKATHHSFHAAGEGGNETQSDMYRSIESEAIRRLMDIDIGRRAGILQSPSQESERIAAEWEARSTQEVEEFFIDTPPAQIYSEAVRIGRALEAQSPAHAIKFYRTIKQYEPEVEFLDDTHAGEFKRLIEEADRRRSECRRVVRSLDEIGTIDTALGAFVSMAQSPEGHDESGMPSPISFPPEYSRWAAEDGLTVEAYTIAMGLPRDGLADAGEMPQTTLARKVVESAYRMLENSLAADEREAQSPAEAIGELRTPEAIRRRLGEILLSPERRDELVRGIHLP